MEQLERGSSNDTNGTITHPTSQEPRTDKATLNLSWILSIQRKLIFFLWELTTSVGVRRPEKFSFLSNLASFAHFLSKIGCLASVGGALDLHFGGNCAQIAAY